MIQTTEDLISLVRDLDKRVKALEASTEIRNLTIPADGSITLPSIAGDPASPSNGGLWYNTNTNKLRGRENGANANLI